MFVLPFAWSSKHINQGIPQQKWSRARAGSRSSASRVSPRVARGEECRWFRRRLGQRCQFCRRWSRRPGSDDSEKKGIEIVESLSFTYTDSSWEFLKIENEQIKQLKTTLMDRKLRETTNLGVEIMNSKRQVKKKRTNSRVPFDVNVMLNLSSNISPLRRGSRWVS